MTCKERKQLILYLKCFYKQSGYVIFFVWFDSSMGFD